MSTNLWVNTEHALGYLRRRDAIPHRVDALEVLCELLPERVDRVLDLGTGDGSTLALVLAAHPGAAGIGVDFGDEMLRHARARFAYHGGAGIFAEHHGFQVSWWTQPVDWGADPFIDLAFDSRDYARCF